VGREDLTGLINSPTFGADQLFGMYRYKNNGPVLRDQKTFIWKDWCSVTAIHFWLFNAG